MYEGCFPPYQLNSHYKEIATCLKNIIHIGTSTSHAVEKINRKVDMFDETHLVYFHQRCGSYFFFSHTQIILLLDNKPSDDDKKHSKLKILVPAFNRTTEISYVILYKKILPRIIYT